MFVLNLILTFNRAYQTKEASVTICQNKGNEWKTNTIYFLILSGIKF